MVRSVDEVYRHQRMLRAKFSTYISHSKYQEIKDERLKLKTLVSIFFLKKIRIY